MNKLAPLIVLLSTPVISAQETPTRIGGVMPEESVIATGANTGREAWIGAVIPWANGLWVMSCSSPDEDHVPTAANTLRGLGPDLHVRREFGAPSGRFTNRFVHWESEQAFIGPFAIKPDGQVRILHHMKEQSIVATMRHLENPDEKVYFLTAEGLFFEIDVNSLGATQLYDLGEELGLSEEDRHFTGGYTATYRVVVSNGTHSNDRSAGVPAGCLAEWDGAEWRIVERNSFADVAGNGVDGPVFASGWSNATAILRVLEDGEWSRYLLPKGSSSFDRTPTIIPTRIRQAQPGRFLMDLHGLFYDLSALLGQRRVPALQPISSHLGIVTDFCHYRGLFVLAGNQTVGALGQPQSNLRFLNIDDLWRMGKPAGSGSLWLNAELEAGDTSDPFLMAGFDKKSLSIMVEGSEDADFGIEVDCLGNGAWCPYAPNTLTTSRGCVHYVFPDGFSAAWVRLVAHSSCRATATFTYR